MNISVTVEGNVYVDFHGIPGDFNGEFEDEIEEEPEEPDGRNGVILCAVKGIPKDLPQEVINAIEKAAFTDFMENFVGKKKGASDEE